jgi:SAM-dependent methyltransferase
MNVCRICNNSNANKTYIAREMMFGYRDEFEYFKCSNCDCLQIKEIPNNLSKYYPEHYYSFTKPRLSTQFFPMSFLRRQRLLYALGKKNLIGMTLSKIFGLPNLPGWIKKAKLVPENDILDIGCGVGRLLLRLKKKGFSRLTGIDPFIEDNIFYKNGVQIFKKEVENIQGQFDFIMLHHSFEHMPDPLSILKHLYVILKHNRHILIRIPVSSSFAWEKYKTNWVQLDAPRHLFLHSVMSIQILSDQVGFKVADIIFDSTAFQFWGSEQYIRDIPLMDSRSYKKNPKGSIFSDEDISTFKKRAKELNGNKNGDSACFYLFKE